MKYSHATERKIRIIERSMGDDWITKLNGKSIDATYNDLVGDIRKTLFCKISPETKLALDQMTDHHSTKIANFIEQLILAEWDRHQDRQSTKEKMILDEFSGLTR